jgi:hypothetical protein
MGGGVGGVLVQIGGEGLKTETERPFQAEWSVVGLRPRWQGIESGNKGRVPQGFGGLLGGTFC